MRKLWLLFLVAGLGWLFSSAAHAQVVTYAFRMHEVENSSKVTATNASLNQYAQFGILSFVANLASDFSNNKCEVFPAVKPIFKKAVVPVLKGAVKAGFLPGEAIYGDGTLTLDLTKGVVEGGILTTAEFSPQSLGVSTLVPTDYEDLGTQSLMCGGASTTSGGGTCGAVCTSAPPDCLEGGTLKVTGSAGIATGYTQLFVYPLANSPEGLTLCQGSRTFTWAECCGDPRLVIVRHLHSTLSSDHTRLFGTITDEEAAGFLEGQQ